MASTGYDSVGKWAAGSNYGPVFSQTDIFLLDTKLELNPIIEHASGSKFNLVFNLATGQTGGFNNEQRETDLEFTQASQPATLPRVSELVIITKASPWCTIVRNASGIQLKDVCAALWTEYTQTQVTEAEFISLPPRLQEQVKRSQAQNSGGAAGGHYMMSAYGSSPVPKRVDWLREKIYFDGLEKDDDYLKKRLGYKAPNVFLMHLQT